VSTALYTLLARVLISVQLFAASFERQRVAPLRRGTFLALWTCSSDSHLTPAAVQMVCHALTRYDTIPLHSRRAAATHSRTSDCTSRRAVETSPRQKSIGLPRPNLDTEDAVGIGVNRPVLTVSSSPDMLRRLAGSTLHLLSRKTRISALYRHLSLSRTPL